MTDYCGRYVHLATLALVGLVCLLPAEAEAQGDGPRVHLPAPAGMNALSLTYMDLASNMNFTQDILIEDAAIESDVTALNYNRFFSLGGRFAEIWVAPIWGTVRGSIQVGDDPPPIIPFPPGASLEVPSVSGLADPYVALKVGLLGAPALPPEQFIQHKQSFQIHALVGAFLPLGKYDGDRLLNLGTNRWTFRLGLPIGNPAKQTYWEIVPSINLFTDNDDPFGADRREQDLLGVLETHLSHNFTKELWGSADLRYQHGGETTTDGVPDDNRLNQFGGGLTLWLWDQPQLVHLGRLRRNHRQERQQRGQDDPPAAHLSLLIR
jgi:hypothetical protein